MSRCQAHGDDGPAHLRALRHFMRRRRRARHGVVIMLVAQPRRLTHSSKHAVDRPDALQQVAHISAPYHNIAAVVDALVRLYTQQRGLGPDIYGSAVTSKVDTVRRNSQS